MTDDLKEYRNITATVIIPSYNSPDLLCAIDSVLQQTYSDIQLIVIDDGSNNFNKVEIEQHIIENKKNNRSFLILVNEENRGTIRSLNRALSFTCGEYVFILAGDDSFYDECVVEDVIGFCVKSQAPVVTGYRMLCDCNLNELGILRPLHKQVKYIERLEPSGIFEKIAPDNFIFGCCTVYSREVFELYKGFDENYRLIEDHSMLLKLLRNNTKIAFCHRIFVKHRAGGTSNISGIDSGYFSECDLIFHNEVEPYTRHIKRISRLYKKWKRKIVFGRNLTIKMNKYNKKSIRRRFALVANYAVHPVYFVDALFIKLHDRRWKNAG